MKLAILLCFTVGCLAGIGFRNPSLLQASPRAATVAPYPAKSPASLHPSRASVAEDTDDAVTMPVDRLMALVDAKRATALCADEILAGWDQPLAALAEWAGLSQEEHKQLGEILQKAAKERQEWETANVKIEASGPGRWALDFPGDGGRFHDELKARIGATFSPEKAEAIDLAGDLGNFFGILPVDPEAKQGRMEFRAWRVDDNGMLDPEGEVLRFDLSLPARGSSQELQVRRDHVFQQTSSMTRFIELLGGAEAVIDASAALSRDMQLEASPR